MSAPIGPNDFMALHRAYQHARADWFRDNPRADRHHGADEAGLLAVARAVVPDGYVVVAWDDLYWIVDHLNRHMPKDMFERLDVALNDGEPVTEGSEMAYFRPYLDACDDPVIGELSRELWLVLSEFPGEVTVQRLFQRVRDRKRFRRVDTLKAPLDHLEDQGYIRIRKQIPASGVGRPSLIITRVRAPP